MQPMSSMATAFIRPIATRSGWPASSGRVALRLRAPRRLECAAQDAAVGTARSDHAAAKAAAQDAKRGKWNTRAVIKNAESPDNILSWIGRAGQCAGFCGWNNLREFWAELYMGTLL
jgi:hypothetical protein